MEPIQRKQSRQHFGAAVDPCAAHIPAHLRAVEQGDCDYGMADRNSVAGSVIASYTS